MTPTPTQYRSYMAPILQPLVDQGLSIRRITQWLNQEGILNRLGRPWYHQNVRDLIDKIGLGGNPTLDPSPTELTDLSDLSDLPDWRVKTGCIADYDTELETGCVVCEGRTLEFSRQALTNTLMVPRPGDPAEFETNSAGKIDALRILRAPTAGERDILDLPPYRDTHLSLRPMGARMHKG